MHAFSWCMCNLLKNGGHHYWVPYTWKLITSGGTPREQDIIRQLSDKLKRVNITGKIHECIASDIIEESLSEAYEHEGTHFNVISTWHYVLCTPYWWPTRWSDVLEYCQECLVCKIANKKRKENSDTSTLLDPKMTMNHYPLNLWKHKKLWQEKWNQIGQPRMSNT